MPLHTSPQQKVVDLAFGVQGRRAGGGSAPKPARRHRRGETIDLTTTPSPPSRTAAAAASRPPPPPTLDPAVRMGLRVQVAGGGGEGVVRFVGRTRFQATGLWVGVELDAGYAGKNDGSVQGHRYFECAGGQQRGLLVRPNRVLPFESSSPARRAQAGGGGFERWSADDDEDGAMAAAEAAAPVARLADANRFGAQRAREAADSARQSSRIAGANSARLFREREAAVRNRPSHSSHHRAARAARAGREEALDSTRAAVMQSLEQWTADSPSSWTLFACSAANAGRPELEKGDKLIVPPSMLENLIRGSDNMGAMLEPMTFALKLAGADDAQDGKAVGVLEFSAEEGTCIVPGWILQTLGVADEANVVQIERIQLPHGTFAKLRPLTSAFGKIPDPKAALEATLSAGYATLSAGDTLLVNGQWGEVHEVQVLETQPADRVCIIEAALEVDFVAALLEGPDSPGTKQASAVERAKEAAVELIAGGAALTASVGEDEYSYFHLAVPTVDEGCGVRISASCSTGDVNLFVSSEDPEPSWSSHQLSSCEGFDAVPTVTLIAIGGDLFVGVSGYRAAATFSVSAAVIDKQVATDAANAAEHSGGRLDLDEELAAGMKRCETCRRAVPGTSFVRHVVFCERNNVRCETCGEVCRRGEMTHTHCPDERCSAVMDASLIEKHVDCCHTPLPCGCGERFELRRLLQHRAGRTHPVCPLISQREAKAKQNELVDCAWCEAKTPRVDLADHEAWCGARTELCALCGDRVLLRERDGHMQTKHQLGADVGATFVAAHAGVDAAEAARAARHTAGQVAAASMGLSVDALQEAPSALEQLVGGVSGGGGSTAARGDGDDPELAAAIAASMAAESGATPVGGAEFACPACGAACDDFEQLQIHMLTVCADSQLF